MTNEMSFLEAVQTNLDDVSELLGLSEVARQSIKTPIRELTVSIPVRMDNGKIRLFTGFRVQHNDALGYTKGGIRFHPDETIDTVRSLASLMTWKCSLVGLPLGGAKGGVIVDTKKLSQGELERLSRGYIRAIADSIGHDKDVPAPDVYTNPQIMAWMLDEFETIKGCHHPGAITGKPIVLGGSEGRSDATAMGGIYALREACLKLGVNPKDTSVAIQGYGNAGYHFARLADDILDCSIVAVSDSRGSVWAYDGFDPENLMRWKEKTGSVIDYPNNDKSTHLESDSVLFADVNVVVPAALENAITIDNAKNIKADIIVELANGPTTPDADKILFKNDIHIIPDFLANAGGVIVSHLESVQNRYCYYWDEKEVYRLLDERITKTYHKVFDISKSKNVNMRQAAFMVAVNRVVEAMRLRSNI